MDTTLVHLMDVLISLNFLCSSTFLCIYHFCLHSCCLCCLKCYTIHTHAHTRTRASIHTETRERVHTHTHTPPFLASYLADSQSFILRFLCLCHFRSRSGIPSLCCLLIAHRVRCYSYIYHVAWELYVCISLCDYTEKFGGGKEYWNISFCIFLYPLYLSQSLIGNQHTGVLIVNKNSENFGQQTEGLCDK